MKKFIVLLLVVCLCVPIVAACSTLKGDNDKGAVVNMYISDFPETLDPSAVQLSADTAMIYNLIYQPLTTINSSGKVEGALAQSWYAYYDKRDGEYMMYFKLNTTMWSDGIAVSADDIVYAWKRILSPENESPYASLLFPIKNAEKVKSGMMTSDDLGLVAEDDTLLAITFESDYDIDLFAEAVSCIALTPLREDIIVKADKDNTDNSRSQDWDKNAAIMVCNGPFRVQGLEEGAKLALERNQYYYRDDEEDKLDKSVIPYRICCYFQDATLDKGSTSEITEPSYQYQRYLDGKIFYLGDFNKETFANVASQVKTSKLLSSYVYYFNTKNDILKDARVRNALSVSIDRQAIVDAIGKNYIASTGFVPSGVFNTTSGTDFRSVGGSIYSTSADTEKAKSLLKDAGVSGGTIRLAYLHPFTKDLEKTNVYSFGAAAVYEEALITAEAVKASWEALGFTVELVKLYPETFQSSLSNGDFDVIGLDYVMNSVDAFGYLSPFATKYSGNAVSISFDAEAYTPHYTGLEDADYDALVDAAVYVKDRAERAEKIHAIETKFAELCPATAVFQYTTSYVASDSLSKITTNYFGFNNYSNLRLKNYISVNSKETEESFNAAKEESVVIVE